MPAYLKKQYVKSWPSSGFERRLVVHMKTYDYFSYEANPKLIFIITLSLNVFRVNRPWVEFTFKFKKKMSKCKFSYYFLSLTSLINGIVVSRQMSSVQFYSTLCQIISTCFDKISIDVCKISRIYINRPGEVFAVGSY